MMMIDSAFLSTLHDCQYLFRLSSTFAWEEAIEFCNRSILGIEEAANAATTASSSAASSVVTNNTKVEYFDEYLDTHFLNNRNETKVLSLHRWIRYVYKQISFSDQWGNTPLHSASFCKPPMDMVMALFQVARSLRRFSSSHIVNCSSSSNNNNNRDDSVNNNDIYNATNLIVWAATCKDGSTPFLVASSTGASTEVLHCYLNEIQYYIDNDWLNENNNQNEWARKTVLRPDFSGNTPLMGWMAYHNGWIKLQLDPSSSDIREFSRLILSDYWELTQRMLQFATLLDNNDDSNQQLQQTTTDTLVRQCASISLYCPISLLEWVVSPHRQGIADDMSIQSSVPWTPADICAATPDRTTGKLPFHVAMEASPCSSFDSTTIAGEDDAVRYTANNPRLEQNRIQMIKKLLKWYPDAACIPFRLKRVSNGNTSPLAAADAAAAVYSDQSEKSKMILRSRSPFLQAIAFGGSWWHSMKAASDCSEDRNGDDNDNMGLVQLLWRLNPGQTSIMDEVSGMYPFMLAAAAAATKRVDCCGSEDMTVVVVDTTYNLLRKDPELVTGALMTMEKK